MTMRKVESGFASVRVDNYGKKQLVYTHYDSPEKFTFYITLPDGDEKSTRVSAFRGDMNELDAKDHSRRKEFLEKGKERAAVGGGETKGPVTRPVVRKAAPADVDVDEIQF